MRYYRITIIRFINKYTKIMDWIESDSYLKGIINNKPKLHDPVRVASFDLDDTLIVRSKKTQKWKLVDSSIKQKIAELIENKYIIIVFTNQGGMSLNKKFDKPLWRKAMDDLVKILTSETDNDFYFAIYVAKKYDIYRKPNIGLWNLMKQDIKDEFNLDSVQISTKSFFCGDAAGRIYPSMFKKKLYPTSKGGDFSDTDRKFALNIGIKFLTPEEFYLDSKNSENLKTNYKLSGVNPTEIIDEIENTKLVNYKFKPRKKEMIVMIGQPGSGKSFFVKNYILPNGYVHINQDKCKTKAKCLSETENALSKGKSVVIDNTNPDVISRMTYTNLAKENNYDHVRAIIMETPDELAKHLNNVRHIYSSGTVPKVTDIAYNIYRKNFVLPQYEENFDKIETVTFYFDKSMLDDPKWKRSFMKFSEYK
ncbi:putative bifunctional polynucleotide phosphatase/kinase [Acanthamoeba castellanii mimivirus]|uniref:Putative bifunctional polynucleotide phosphatase/kinase n=6 Tax=Mimivirus TaxID=315393 RepID=PNKP_MIMIV|nr:putative bifunctional polynucleotide phosphatase/kinase [Acanthamoeba polyphaga mimivirus]Q5UQD2.1 RecName: Full=Putative bifunctional polynucleotide phosphatase/kinase; AltName: Full=DNA 5'-kinase/3'-phosphatase; AltName: Full=Polynucleotide kinase-3'-phosphatase; Includes: RecName: Full=Polynucleotide 3'-phosphatase; AltName: Full=2'(3')-polynucleotidase; Includes: RecName: Full=Polynucleotide 5'-hydroxyl-kinase [Acanthamoeba polyphaga mimivirus]ALR84059.1 putative bifunctional polynucleotid